MSASIPTSHEALVSQPAASAAQAAAASVSRSDSPTQRGVDAGSRLYEFWNTIFARAGTSTGDEPSPVTQRPSSRGLMSEAGQTSSHVQTSGQWEFAVGDSALLPTLTGLARRAGPDPVIARFQVQVAEVQTSGSSVHLASFARNPSNRATSISSEPDVGESVHTANPIFLPEEKSTAPQRSQASDSVSVFVRGAAVSIVVRDALISPHEALDCAFETARHLTGQRAALLRLTLNGQPLYRQPTAQAHAPPALLFAC